jgi:hypothetical protein
MSLTKNLNSESIPDEGHLDGVIQAQSQSEAVKAGAEVR